MAEQTGQLFFHVTGIIILGALARFTWAIRGELAEYAMMRIWPLKFWAAAASWQRLCAGGSMFVRPLLIVFRGCVTVR